MIDKLKEIKELLSSVKSGSEENIDLWIDYAWELGYINAEEGTAVLNDAIELGGKIGYVKGIAYAKGMIGLLSFGRHNTNIEQSKSRILDALNIANVSDDKERAGWFLMGLSMIDWGMGNLESGFAHAMKALDKFKEIN